MPFNDKYRDSYEYGIKVAIEQSGYIYYRADKEISNVDIMCKICKEIQSCGLAIFNISGHNPNVMLELGLAYGLSKSVIIIKDVETKNIADLGSTEYIEYLHANDLAHKLITALSHITV
jgi:nucleoside 2-deoxyribosyltransferase